MGIADFTQQESPSAHRVSLGSRLGDVLSLENQSGVKTGWDRTSGQARPEVELDGADYRPVMSHFYAPVDKFGV
jgi:hypothetical protein